MTPGSPDSIKLILVAGPTAAGKTALAIELARKYDGEIIHADSRQVYRYMDIGTAKPTGSQRKAVRHHLLDVVNPDQAFSAGEFLRLAGQKITQIAASGRTVIVEGGTGLYLRTLTDGLVDNPPRDEVIMRSLKNEVQERGLDFLYNQLKEVDRESASRINRSDEFRIIRALEVWRQTGQPVSAWRKKFTRKPPYDCLVLGITQDRKELYERINRRVELMIKSGWVDEVKELLNKGYKPDAPGMLAVGYRQLAAYLAGELSREKAVELIKRDSRRFAKRQLTWFRKVKQVIWLDQNPPEFPGNLYKTVENWLH